MPMNFDELKRSRGSLTEKIQEQSKKFNSKQSFEEDTRFWKPGVDKAGNGFAVIRFLPPSQGEEDAIIRYWDHFFKGPGGWYVEKSRTTMGWDHADPVAECNKELWDAGHGEGDSMSEERKQASRQKRRLHHVANILVKNDPVNPENNGKVFLYDFGVVINRMIDKMLNPVVSEFEDASEVDIVNVFDFWEGADFKIVIRQEGDKPRDRRYTESKFLDPAPVADSDDEIEKIWLSQYSLQEFVDPSSFKSYEDLKARLDRVLGRSGGEQNEQSSTPSEEEPETPTSSAEDIPFEMEDNSEPQAEQSVGGEQNEDDGMSWFENLAKDD